jgi:hypothetical protein
MQLRSLLGPNILLIGPGVRDLERAVEELSELLEMPIESENIASLRQRMTDKTVRYGSWPLGHGPTAIDGN